MKVYIAAPWPMKERARRVAEMFEAAGIEITAGWLTHPGKGDSAGTGYSVQELQEQAHRDISDVLRSDYLVVLNYGVSEGKAVETGIALQAGISIITVGRRNNIFSTLAIEVDSAIDALAYLQSHTPSGRK